MARQLQERFPVGKCFIEVAELLSEARPDVVHITTPPASHFEIASSASSSGCHVYVEKPFTLDADEAQRLVDLAEKKGAKLTAGHNYQFSHVARRMRALVESGYLGGAPVHMESYYGYDLGSPSYARALLGDQATLGPQIAGEIAAQHHQPRDRQNCGVSDVRRSTGNRTRICQPASQRHRRD